MLQAWSAKEALHYIIADQAGSGKTLAYLLPLVQVWPCYAMHCIAMTILDQAGSGKTLADLLPLVQLWLSCAVFIHYCCASCSLC